MPDQVYEYYWSITNAYTDYNGEGFLSMLQIMVDFIGEKQPFSERRYDELQRRVHQSLARTGGVPTPSDRKRINQLVKLGFVNSFLESYHPDTPAYLNAQTDSQRQSLLSKIVYSNSSLDRSVTEPNDAKEISFLIKTLKENGSLTRNEIAGLMRLHVNEYPNGCLNRQQLNAVTLDAVQSGFIDRKYNQIDHFCNLLSKLDDLEMSEGVLRLKKDPEDILNEELEYRNKTTPEQEELPDGVQRKVRDPYLHRIFKNQLKEETTRLIGGKKCMLENRTYPVLVASHIKPFIECDEREAYDPNNGLLLSRTIDSLFDLKYISFCDDGTIIFYGKIHQDVRDFWKDYKLDGVFLIPERLRYLQYHRTLCENMMMGKTR